MRQGLTGIPHGEELFGILAVSLSTNSLWGCQLQAERDVTVRFDSTVTTLSDGSSVGDILTSGSIGHVLPQDHDSLTKTSLTVTIVLLGTTEKVLRMARREETAESIMCGWFSAWERPIISHHTRRGVLHERSQAL
jgi:hypothetical protein